MDQEIKESGQRPIGQNDQAQAPPAQDNQQAEKVTAGGCLPRPCSGNFCLVSES